MIKLIIGGIGQGKTISAVKEMIDRNVVCYSNFPIKMNKMIRLKVEHIIKEEIELTPRGKEKKTLRVNWEYWNKIRKKGELFDIMIDEAHNVLHSRRSMSKFNTLFTTWLAQVRKILGTSKHHHLYLITQRLNGIDIAVRDLAHEIIYVNKAECKTKIKTRLKKNNRYVVKEIPKIYIRKTSFKGNYCLEKFEGFLNGVDMFDNRTVYLANPYFQFYDTYEIIDFGESVYI